MLCHQMSSLAMGSNFHTVYPRQPQQHLILCTPHQFINCMPRKCISALLRQNPTTQSSMHQIFTHMHSTVSLGPSYMKSPIGFLQAPPPQTAFPHISLQNLFLLLPTHFIFVRTLKTIEKRIHFLPSCSLLSNDPGPPDLSSGLLSNRPLMYIQFGSSETLYT